MGLEKTLVGGAGFSWNGGKGDPLLVLYLCCWRQEEKLIFQDLTPVADLNGVNKKKKNSFSRTVESSRLYIVTNWSDTQKEHASLPTIIGICMIAGFGELLITGVNDQDLISAPLRSHSGRLVARGGSGGGSRLREWASKKRSSEVPAFPGTEGRVIPCLCCIYAAGDKRKN